MHEPDAKLEYSDDPDQEEGWYTWDGQRIGAGRLTHVRLDAPDRIDQRIEFIRPFKDDLGPAMQEAFPKLAAHVEQSGGKKAGCPFTAYHKADVKAMYFECDMAIRVGDDVPDGEYERKTLGGGKYFKVTAQGSYDFLELAWYSAMSHLQMLKRKMDDSRPSLEVYENDPESVSHTNEIMTTIYIPIR